MRILVISDIHSKEYVYTALNDLREKLDCIIIAGDVIDGEEDIINYPYVLRQRFFPLTRLYDKFDCPIYMTLGESDKWLRNNPLLISQVPSILDTHSADIHVLIDKQVQLPNGMFAWFTPWTVQSEGNWTREDTGNSCAHIPENTDIIVTHCPAYTVLDEMRDEYSSQFRNVGSSDLYARIQELRGEGALKYVFSGHIHGSDYLMLRYGGVEYYNVSCLRDDYTLKNGFVILDI